MPPLDVIEPHMTLFQDQRAKELLVTPKGVRLVYQAAQAEQGPYQTLRLVRFPLEPLESRSGAGADGCRRGAGA